MKMKEWFEQNNPEALAQITERMLEAIRKEYWQPDEETMKTLLETYQEMAAKYDVQTINEKFKEFVKVQAQGYGLDKPSVTPVALPKVQIPQPSQQQATQQVEGQKLEKVEQTATEQDFTMQYMLMSLLGLTLLAGVFWQMSGWRRV